MQGVLTVWVFTWRTIPFVVLAGTLSIILAAAAVIPLWSGRLPPPRAFLTIILSPLVIIIWSGINWAAEEHGAGGGMGWRLMVHTALALGCVLAALVTPYRFRRSPRVWLLVLCSLTAILYSAAAWFVGGMAITNDWL